MKAAQLKTAPRPKEVELTRVSPRRLRSDYYIHSLKQRVQLKKLNGQRLSAVEIYLSRHTAQLERRLFAPSLLSVCTEVSRVFLRPAPIIIVLALIIASEASSSASSAQTKPISFEEDLDLIDYSEALLEDMQPPEDEIAAIEAASDAAPIEQPTTAEKENFVFASLNAYETIKQAQVPAPSVVIPQPTVIQTQPGMVPVVAVETLPSALPKDSPATLATKYRGLVEFISGVIAVYYPAELDSGKIAKHIVELSHEERVDPLYVAALIATESSFKSHAKSSVGATGLMQLRPSTAREVVLKQFGKKGNPALTDPKTNIKLGIRYLKQLEKRYRGNRHLALAAYNWGPGNIDKAQKGYQHIPTSVNGYAKKILEKTLRWNRHFNKASKTAAELERQPIG